MNSNDDSLHPAGVDAAPAGSPSVVLVLANGVEGRCLYMNDTRIAGPKPWGGGTTEKTWVVSCDEIARALPDSEDDALYNVRRLRAIIRDHEKTIKQLRAALSEANTTMSNSGDGETNDET